MFVVVLIILLVVVTLLVRLQIRRQRRRDLVLYQQWNWIQSQQRTVPDAGLAQILTVYQRARRGSKAVIMWLATGYRQDTWFAHNWPHAGSIVLLRGSTGWGPHNLNPDVFYVSPNQFLSLLPPDTMAAVQRQQQREAKRVSR